MIAEHGYCHKCGCALETRDVWVENRWITGPQPGSYQEETYCPECERREQAERAQYQARREAEEQKRKEKAEAERLRKRNERLQKYKKYLPKKVTSIVLFTEEAALLKNLVNKEIRRVTQGQEDLDVDALCVYQVLSDKLYKADLDTRRSDREAEELAIRKGWEKE